MITIALLEAIERISAGVVATVTGTEGHTYKKVGAKAVFRPNDPSAVHGNLGSLCADQEIQRVAGDVVSTARNRSLRIDTSDPDDAIFGYGTACGGVMEILLEPVDKAMKAVYRTLRTTCFRNNEPAFLIHDFEAGGIALVTAAPDPEPGRFIEPVPRRQELTIFGATPLAARLIDSLRELPFRIHLVDWRPAHVDPFRRNEDLTVHEELPVLDAGAFVLVLSHSYERDRACLRQTLEAGCRYVGLLSSRPRRDALYEDLRAEGADEERLRRIRSPVGLPLGGRSDPEIAVAILAELIRELHR
ncbi:MAG: hypothetical protein GF346_07085 [Candidatus Eisenbacteria bacterium]|nr:hypothetical protein [Candidatus Latescibacterota bacterium]MBD3302194.1 hypothetical protein [Candidatus Eisenbacteria bacterium]